MIISYNISTTPNFFLETFNRFLNLKKKKNRPHPSTPKLSIQTYHQLTCRNGFGSLNNEILTLCVWDKTC